MANAINSINGSPTAAKAFLNSFSQMAKSSSADPSLFTKKEL